MKVNIIYKKDTHKFTIHSNDLIIKLIFDISLLFDFNPYLIDRLRLLVLKNKKYQLLQYNDIVGDVVKDNDNIFIHFDNNLTLKQFKDKDDNTFLHHLVMYNNDQLFNKFSKDKSYFSQINDQNKFGESPIWYAKSKNILEGLVENGADLNIENKNGNTFLSKIKDITLIVYLIYNGADYNNLVLPNEVEIEEVINDKEKLLKFLEENCYDMLDPITLNEFKKLSIPDLENIIMIGKENKRNCFEFKTTYKIYKDAIRKGDIPLNPMNRIQLSDDEIKKIKSSIDYYELYHPRIIGLDEQIKLKHTTYEIEYFDTSLNVTHFELIDEDNNIIMDLGWIPTHDTNIINAINELWKKHKLLINDRTCCNIPMVSNPEIFLEEDFDIDKFINRLMNEIKKLGVNIKKVIRAI